jgi:hypothetical protein
MLETTSSCLPKGTLLISKYPFLSAVVPFELLLIKTLLPAMAVLSAALTTLPLMVCCESNERGSSNNNDKNAGNFMPAIYDGAINSYVAGFT